MQKLIFDVSIKFNFLKFQRNLYFFVVSLLYLAMWFHTLLGMLSKPHVYTPLSMLKTVAHSCTWLNGMAGISPFTESRPKSSGSFQLLRRLEQCWSNDLNWDLLPRTLKQVCSNQNNLYCGMLSRKQLQCVCNRP